MAHQVKILRQTISVCAQFIVYCTFGAAAAAVDAVAAPIQLTRYYHS